MKALTGVCLALLCTACTHVTAPPASSRPVEEMTGKVSPNRIKAALTDADERAAKARLFTAVEPQGWVFDTLFATAADASGTDLAVCGFASRPRTGVSIYFAYYNGELLLWDETAEHGASVENQFLAFICSYK